MTLKIPLAHNSPHRKLLALLQIKGTTAQIIPGMNSLMTSTLFSGFRTV
jgi:hypothetical protein